MLRRKFSLFSVIFLMFFLVGSIGNVEKVNAVASCTCSTAYFGDPNVVKGLSGFDRVNGKNTPEAIGANNCPAEATLVNPSNGKRDTRTVFPICIRVGEEKNNTWGCHCFMDYYATDITQNPNIEYPGSVPAGSQPQGCAAGGNCCTCGLDLSTGKSVKMSDFCAAGTQYSCANAIDSNAFSNNCSCIAKPITAVPYSLSNPFTGCSANSINTALGCIPVDMNEFIKWLLPFLFGIAGGISFLLMVYGFILITLSKGDPKKVQGAKETITSAITGLLLSIFSLFILRLIVSGILKLPGVN